MENTDYERPNTVSGLNAKRKELVKLLGNITADAEKVRKGIKHIDACVALFDPSAKPLTTYHDGFIPRHTDRGCLGHRSIDRGGYRHLTFAAEAYRDLHKYHQARRACC
jgi:hypothetical protein